MLCVAAWVWFCLSTEFVVVPLDRYDPAASGGGDIPARPAWSTSSATRTGDWGVDERIDAGAHPSSPGQTCPSMALHPSHAMSTASVSGPDSIAANLDFAPIAASAPTLHDVTAARPDLAAWLLHHLYGLLCEAVFFFFSFFISHVIQLYHKRREPGARNIAGAEALAVARRPEEASRERTPAAAGIERFFSLRCP